MGKLTSQYILSEIDRLFICLINTTQLCFNYFFVILLILENHLASYKPVNQLPYPCRKIENVMPFIRWYEQQLFPFHVSEKHHISIDQNIIRSKFVFSSFFSYIWNRLLRKCCFVSLPSAFSHSIFVNNGVQSCVVGKKQNNDGGTVITGLWNSETLRWRDRSRCEQRFLYPGKTFDK